MNIDINTDNKRIDVYVDNISKEDLINLTERYEKLSDYEMYIHNQNQIENLIDVYVGNIIIDNLGYAER